MNKCKSAFSLVEMLMTLLVASLLLAALAPVITKRIGNETLSVAGFANSSGPPPKTLCYAYNVTNPTIEVPLEDIWNVNFVIASGGGGGGGASKEAEEDKIIFIKGDNTTSGNNDSSPILITESMAFDSIDVTLVGGGGGGGGAAAYGITSYTSENKTEGGKETVIAGTDCSKYNNSVLQGNMCVYKGYTGSASYATAASNCANLSVLADKSDKGKWRLPSLNEMLTNWNKDTLNLGCANYWSTDPITEYYSYCPGNGMHNLYTCYGMGTGSACRSDSVKYRCVLLASTILKEIDTTVNYTNYIATSALKTFSASSGGSAPGFNSLKDTNNEAYTALQYAIRNNIGGKITITAGGGGALGTSDLLNKTSTGNTNAKNGEKGKDSCILILNKSGAVVYKVCAKGGRAGLGVANISNISSNIIETSAANTQTSNGCYYTAENITKEFDCNGGKEGNKGTSLFKTETITTRDSLVYPAFIVSTNAAAGGAGLTIAGQGAGTYGTGGNGAAASNNVDVNGVIKPSVINATNGGAGFARIIYKNKFKAAGGGGGGGGAIVQLKDIYIGKTATCTLVIGKGGKGGDPGTSAGANGAKGHDGESSSISCSPLNFTYTVPGGSGGGGGSSANASGSLAIAGLGGAGTSLTPDDMPSNIKNDSNKYDYLNGKKGENANFYENYSAGGTGGQGGNGAPGGCGALFNSDDNSCLYDINIPATLNMLIGKGYSDNNMITPPSDKNLVAIPPSFGISSAGGGGGAWYKDIGAGGGGDGMGGYICVYWTAREAK